VKPVIAALLILHLCLTLFAADTPSTPGTHKKQNCAVAGQTFDLYLPKSYADKPEKKFPSLYISAPHKNPGFRKLTDWAEKHEVVLITINESENGDWAPILKAQDAVWEATAYLRLHPNLHFSMGFSGGAAASLELAKRKGKNFAGCVLHCHSGNTQGVPRHLALGFISGEKDSTHPASAVRGSVSATEKSNFVQSHFFPDGGHSWYDGAVQEEFLSNMLLYATLTHPGLDKKEKKANLDAFAQQLAALDDKTSAAERLALVSPMISCEDLRKEAVWSKAVDVWCAAKAEMIAAAGNGLDAYKMIVDEKTAARLKMAKSSKPAVDKAVKAVLSNPELRKEIAAYTAYAAIADKEAKQREKRKVDAPDLIKRYTKHSEANAGTWAAELAQAAVERLKKKA
jgi:hypothetical protein